MGFGVETTYGTGVAATFFQQVTSDGLKEERGFEQKPELYSTSNVTRVAKKRKVGGPFSLQMPWDGAATLLKWALGASTPSGSNPYTHAIACARALPFFSIWSNRDATAISGSAADQWVSCQIAKMTLKQEMEEPLMATFDIIGQKRTKAAKPTPTFVLKDVLEWTQFNLLAIDADGSPVGISTRGWELTVENPIYEDHYILGSATKSGTNRNGPRKVMLSLEAEWNSLGEEAVFIADTPHDWQLIYNDGASRNMTITMPNCIMNEFDNPVNNSGGINFNATVQADQSAAELDEITISFKNATATI
jgi:hypothetical protein